MSRKKYERPRITTPADAWDYGYQEDALHLDMFGQYLPIDMVPADVPQFLQGTFQAGSEAHTNDIARGRKTPTPNPHKEAKS